MNPLTYALLAQDAYTCPPQIGAEDSAARAIIEATIDGTAVAFPGTNNVACWLADLDCDVVEVPGLGRLHEGFRNAFLSIKDALLDRCQAEGEPIIPVGHSEGAALALILAGELCLAGRAPKAVFAFEPPRVAACDTLGKLLAAHGVEVFLYRNGFDVVPMVPRLFADWQHPAPLIEIGHPTEPWPNVTDHDMDRVVGAVRATVLQEA